jgi:hypothetical protein
MSTGGQRAPEARHSLLKPPLTLERPIGIIRAIPGKNLRVRLTMSKRVGLVVLASVVALLGTAHQVWAQQPQINPDVYSQLQFRYIGPVGNRATTVAGVAGSPYIYYVGAASGGIFKSTDGGLHWDPVVDSQPVSSIGSLAVSARDP